jgi:hypothetical protein
LIGNYHFAHDYGCVHPGMPLGRKHLRRSRDAPTGGIGPTQRATSRLGAKPSEVNGLMREGDPKVQQVAALLDEWFRIRFIDGLDSNISDTSRSQACPENLFWNQPLRQAI